MASYLVLGACNLEAPGLGMPVVLGLGSSEGWGIADVAPGTRTGEGAFILDRICGGWPCDYVKIVYCKTAVQDCTWGLLNTIAKPKKLHVELHTWGCCILVDLGGWRMSCCEDEGEWRAGDAPRLLVGVLCSSSLGSLPPRPPRFSPLGCRNPLLPGELDEA